MEYNSKLKKLVLPEYGRHIQKMVDYAVTIEDRKERSECVDTIISVMGNFFPHLRDVSDFNHKLWDHIAIMSDFKLDIDFPYELPEREHFSQKPLKVPYSHTKMHYKHYGIIIERMISEAVKMEEGEAKNQLIANLLSQMRKSLLNWNKDNATDERLTEDIKLLSGGQIHASEQQIRASEVQSQVTSTKKRKKHKR
ncbi:MAG: DUF4290 domain-containing protein [Marinilabiliaceae bacterium]|nr:DUF4290 domain-containing protein [Marinilabiliaceae bacterium]